VRSQVEKYKKLRFTTNENIGYGEIYLPAEEMQTRALVLIINPNAPSGQLLHQLSAHVGDSILYGIGNLLRQLIPMAVLCDIRDVGMASRIRDPFFDAAALYFFDMYPGGTGIAEALWEHLSTVIVAGLERIVSCPLRKRMPLVHRR